MYVSLKLQKLIASHQFQWTNVAMYTLLGPVENFSNSITAMEYPWQAYVVNMESNNCGQYCYVHYAGTC